MDEDLDVMIVANEDLNNTSKNMLSHKPSCVYFEEIKQLNNSNGFQTVKASPDKKAINSQKEEIKLDLLGNLNSMDPEPERIKKDFLKVKAGNSNSNRTRS